MPTPAQLELPSPSDERLEPTPIDSDGIPFCVCGTAPTGVAFISEKLLAESYPNHRRPWVEIKCPLCGDAVMSDTRDAAVALWKRHLKDL